MTTRAKSLNLKIYKRRVDQVRSLLKQSDLTVSQIAARIFLSRIRTDHIMRGLERDGMVHVTDYDTAAPNRAPRLYRWGNGVKAAPPRRRDGNEIKRPAGRRSSLPADIGRQQSLARIYAGLGIKPQEQPCSQ